MMAAVLNAVFDVPGFVRELFTGDYRLYAIIGAIVFLLIALVDSKFTHVLRELLVLAGIVIAIIAYFKKMYTIAWISAILLLILAVICLLRYLLVTIRQNRINRRIEKRALEKAAKRRGSWQEKKGFSGKRNINDVQPVIYSMNEDEIHDVVDNETTERQGAKIPVDDARVMPVQNAFTQETASTQAADDGTLSRTVVIDAIQKLTDLRDLGVLTDEEFVKKRTWLYSHLG